MLHKLFTHKYLDTIDLVLRKAKLVEEAVLIEQD